MNLLQYSAFSPYCTMFKQPSIPRLNNTAITATTHG